MNNQNCGACGMLNSRGFCSLTACRFPIINGLGTWQERILANKPKPSNADRIRAMTDEELAEWMANKAECQYCSVRSEWCTESEASCRTNWLDWLKEEAVSDG